jgi:acetate kinase
MTISARFLKSLSYINISDREFCRRYGFNRTSLHYVKQGKREAQVEWLAALVKHHGIDAKWLLIGE